MVDAPMKAGDSRMGFLFDDVDDNLGPSPGTLHLSETGGIVVEVLSIHPQLLSVKPAVRDSFAKTHEWVDPSPESVPKTLTFESVDGAVTLSGVRSGGSRGWGVSLANLRADVAIFAKPTVFNDEYKIEEFCSTIDGLDKYCSFRGFRFSDLIEVDDEDSPPIKMLPTEVIEWESGGFRFELESQLSSSGQEGKYFRLKVEAKLRTIAPNGASIFEHYAAQRKVRALLVLAFGCRLPWRSHDIRDAQFPVRFLSGDKGPAIPVPVILARTLAQHSEASPTSSQLAFPAVRLRDIGASGMQKWCDSYDDEDFRRAVEPGVEAIATEGAFVEPTVMMLAVSLDRFGYCDTGRQRRALEVHVKHCLDTARIDWPTVGSNLGLARFIAGVNNALKHPDYAHRPDKNGYPAMLELYAVRELLMVVVRAQILAVTYASDDVFAAFLNSPSVRQANELFERNNLTIDDSGTVHTGQKRL